MQSNNGRVGGVGALDGLLRILARPGEGIWLAPAAGRMRHENEIVNKVTLAALADAPAEQERGCLEAVTGKEMGA